ncbi:MAG: sigma-70 family RNA polymerase sigma factor [Planctomycetes bacterium]|nr:sigma-70 family RNA polymerase sigma factor [Planctomycetota bacterium]
MGQVSTQPEGLPRDEVLLRNAALRGDPVAWDRLLERNFPLVQDFLRRRAIDEERVLDLAQETWMVALKRLRDFDPGRASFASWLRGIAVRLELGDNRRRAARRAAREPVEGIAAQVPSGESLRLEEILSVLDPEERRLLEAKYLEQLSTAQIAARAGLTAKAVESRLVRARREFRRYWKGDIP